jgi:DNA-binding NtrC family response regulator
MTIMRKFALPMPTAENKTDIKKKEPALEPPQKRRARILVVDDDASMRRIISHELEGYTVGTANDGIHGLELFKSGEFDLVVTDLKMPNMGGMELLAEILIINPEAKVIVISGYIEEPTRNLLMQIGAAAVLEKPTGVIEINEHVGRILLN